ncbi:hypothetical protein NW757_007318 [Fusarium falciforme]|nr:hypothetical protein NW757_007318 [Fusarium falciforme]
MHSKILNVAILAMLAAGGSTATHRVEVGQRGRFAPDTITADKGDIVEFHFNAMHNVVAGDFKNPCTPIASGGFYSGTMPVGDKHQPEGSIWWHPRKRQRHDRDERNNELSDVHVDHDWIPIYDGDRSDFRIPHRERDCIRIGTADILADY